jgi:hypothetical protein
MKSPGVIVPQSVKDYMREDLKAVEAVVEGKCCGAAHGECCSW